MSTEPMADEAEFATFLETASVSEVAAQAFDMLKSLEKALDAVMDVEWSHVTRTVARMRELAHDAPNDVLQEMNVAIRAASLFAEVDEALGAMAREQHGN